MIELLVKKLDPRAILPSIAHPGEDLGYDLYSIENVVLYPNHPVLISTGISAKAIDLNNLEDNYGLLIRGRSSLGVKGVNATLAGVIDSTYLGEIKVLLNYDGFINNYGSSSCFPISAGSKIAQMIPIRVYANTVKEVNELPIGSRGIKGFGSSGL